MEENRGPADFGEEEDDDLSDDQEAVEDGPEDACRLFGNGRIPMGGEYASAGTRGDRQEDIYARNIIIAHCRRVAYRGRVRVVRIVLVGVESSDILNEGQDAARKDENEGDYAQNPDDVQSDEHVWGEGRLATRFPTKHEWGEHLQARGGSMVVGG